VKKKYKWIAYDENGGVLIIAHSKKIVAGHLQDLGYVVIYNL
tara:strand:- start:177 stop:302 length:126 start_codon:yes stop_codon:yes gene_type:complete